MPTWGVIGVVLCLGGAVWIRQGTNAMHGSGMSGHGQWAILGVVIGLALLAPGAVVRHSGRGYLRNDNSSSQPLAAHW